MFGTQFLENTCIVFTRWGWSKKDVSSRAKNGDSMENKRIDVQNWFSKLFSYNKPIPCFLIENGYNATNVTDFSEIDEIIAFTTQLNALREFIISRPPFDCKDIQAVLAERDRKEKELRDLEEAHKAKEAEMKRKMDEERDANQRAIDQRNREIAAESQRQAVLAVQAAQQAQIQQMQMLSRMMTHFR